MHHTWVLTAHFSYHVGEYLPHTVHFHVVNSSNFFLQYLHIYDKDKLLL